MQQQGRAVSYVAAISHESSSQSVLFNLAAFVLLISPSSPTPAFPGGRPPPGRCGPPHRLRQRQYSSPARRRRQAQEPHGHEGGIQLPTIVVVGDQSSGKSSILESLASLPWGQENCTRVPLIMRLQNHRCDLPQLYLEFNGKVVRSDEENKPRRSRLPPTRSLAVGRGYPTRL
ncbi:hypothetical protein MLD38_017783 [Melastoma candidum]|uniref:Uncharacterized protein n=1 Tax=Melastoma candidum TaxID=119954 RepID=A0ACB9QVA1_9MYRT|nr:hypothetical protein MLD38_017783 [Melastoma candidum]